MDESVHALAAAALADGVKRLALSDTLSVREEEEGEDSANGGGGSTDRMRRTADVSPPSSSSSSASSAASPAPSTFAERLALLSRASGLVAVDGAGLGHMGFLPTDERSVFVVELLSTRPSSPPPRRRRRRAKDLSATPGVDTRWPMPLLDSGRHDPMVRFGAALGVAKYSRVRCAPPARDAKAVCSAAELLAVVAALGGAGVGQPATSFSMRWMAARSGAGAVM